MSKQKGLSALIETKAQLQVISARMIKAPVTAWDTETTGLDWKKDRFLGYSCADNTKEAFFGFAPKPKDSVPLSKALASPGDKVGHNIKFDRHFLRNAGYEVKGKIYDTLFMAKLWNEMRDNHKLKSLASELVDAGAAETLDALKDWLEKNKKSMSDLASVPKTLLVQYGANDAKITLALFFKLKELLEADKIPWDLVERERMTLDLAFEMEHTGVVVNKPFLERYKKQLLEEQAQVKRKMDKVLKRGDYNPGSDDQVREILKGLGWKPAAHTDTGKAKVDKRALGSFEHPWATLLLEHRRLGTICSTFVEGILDRAVKRKDGWTVHTEYNTSGARTGRWSSNSPNLQNVDKKSEARKAFIPRKGTDLWMFDYKQIEPVLFAHFSQSTRLQQAFRDGLDFHSMNASAAFGVPIAKVAPEQRTKAKALGLAIMYQAGAGKAAQMMGVTEQEGRQILASYYATFPEIKTFQRETTNTVERRAEDAAEKAGKLKKNGRLDWVYEGRPLPHKKVPKAGQPGEFWTFIDKTDITEAGWIKNPFGRKLRLPINDAYKALNSLIQSTAGDVLKEAMVRIGRVPLLQVHDELVFELPKGPKGKVIAREIKAKMESLQVLFPDVPIRVDVAIATKNWGEEKEVKL